MGFDIYALNQETENNYFRNNCWWWRPLWALCYDVSKDTDLDEGISQEDYGEGTYNNGHKITEEQAIELNELLLDFLKDEEEVAKFIKDYPKKYDLYMYEWSDEIETKPYPFDLENVKKFAEFCLTSGGFEIC